MFFKKIKPKTPGIRHQLSIQKNLLSRQNRLIKPLCYKIQSHAGRSMTTGRISIWGRSSGCKKLYRQLNYSNYNLISIVLFTTYDPYRHTFITLNFNLLTYTFYYTLAINNLRVGSIIKASTSKLYDVTLGYRGRLVNMPPGTLLHAVELYPSSKYATYAKSAGTFCQLLQKTQTVSKLRIPSGQIITINSNCWATIGIVDNLLQKFTILGKAGRKRLLGFRPSVRGCAMNPVDHPHGGRTKNGFIPMTPWGKLTKNVKTSRMIKQKIYKL
tara:strand:- start:25316 stop:26128 length:813 start_codon:yes stop_codon:yes gene_type:complete